MSAHIRVKRFDENTLLLLGTPKHYFLYIYIYFLQLEGKMPKFHSFQTLLSHPPPLTQALVGASRAFPPQGNAFCKEADPSLYTQGCFTGAGANA